MTRKRPCRICRRWFQPHVRVGDRQHVCSEAACQRERVRRSVAVLREEQAEDEKEDRLRRRLRKAASASATDASAPLAGLDLGAARNAVGMEVAVFVEETARELAAWTRNAVTAQVHGIAG